MLEELAERDLTEVIPMLLAKIKQWEARKAAAARLQTYCKMWVYKMMYRNKKKAAQKVDIRRDIRRDLRRVEPASHLGDLSRPFPPVTDPAHAAVA